MPRPIRTRTSRSRRRRCGNAMPMAPRRLAGRAARRALEPGSMRDGSVLIGWGVATATYPVNRSAAGARIVFDSDGTVAVQSGTQDLGTGTYTVVAQLAADA